jgi:hypothetical protein
VPDVDDLLRVAENLEMTKDDLLQEALEYIIEGEDGFDFISWISFNRRPKGDVPVPTENASLSALPSDPD